MVVVGWGAGGGGGIVNMEICTRGNEVALKFVTLPAPLLNTSIFSYFLFSYVYCFLATQSAVCQRVNNRRSAGPVALSYRVHEFSAVSDAI